MAACHANCSSMGVDAKAAVRGAPTFAAALPAAGQVANEAGAGAGASAEAAGKAEAVMWRAWQAACARHSYAA